MDRFRIPKGRCRCHRWLLPIEARLPQHTRLSSTTSAAEICIKSEWIVGERVHQVHLWSQFTAHRIWNSGVNAKLFHSIRKEFKTRRSHFCFVLQKHILSNRGSTTAWKVALQLWWNTTDAEWEFKSQLTNLRVQSFHSSDFSSSVVRNR